ncbi:MAG: endonuclease [Flavobacteriales bacterium]|nr:endonuclease [Flavobacteriales bacterium]
MRVIILVSFVISIPLCAQPPAGYYDPAEGLTGEPLRIALRGIIENHSVLAYNSLWSAFGLTDRKPNNMVWDMYSDVPDGTAPYEYAFVEDQCGNYNSEGDCFNREHSFPQSWFNSAPPMDTDLFHLYPTDAWVNQNRGNSAFGEVGVPTWTSENGSKVGSCAYPGCSGTVFEPIDAYKGDLARSYFYMLTRYYGVTGSWSSPMMQNGDFKPWVQSMLLQWHEDDPVSQKEIDRNNRIFISLQFNRNPFIDRPEWAYSIWGPTASVADRNNTSARMWMDDGVLHIQRTNAIGQGTIAVYSAQGELVRSGLVNADRMTMELDVAPGLYITMLDLPEGRSTGRVLR